MSIETRSPDLTQALSSICSNADLANYCEILDIRESQLIEPILDIGAGMKNRFANSLRSRKHKNTFAVNPQLVLDDRRKKLRRNKAPITAALAQALPFRDESFNTIISLYAVPMHLRNDDVEVVFSEIYRLLKPGGQAYLCPLTKMDYDLITQTDLMDRYHCKVEVASYVRVKDQYIRLFRARIFKR